MRHRIMFHLQYCMYSTQAWREHGLGEWSDPRLGNQRDWLARTKTQMRYTGSCIACSSPGVTRASGRTFSAVDPVWKASRRTFFQPLTKEPRRRDGCDQSTSSNGEAECPTQRSVSVLSRDLLSTSCPRDHSGYCGALHVESMGCRRARGHGARDHHQLCHSSD